MSFPKNSGVIQQAVNKALGLTMMIIGVI